MPAICLCYEVHEPYNLRRYTVFDMGHNSLYEDDDRNCDTLLYNARACYLPTNDLFLKLIKRHKKEFRFAVSISGTALDQFEQYAPEVIDSFKALAATGCVEFMGETSAHSLAFLYSKNEFNHQVKTHSARIKTLFGKKPITFRHAEFIYNNDLAWALKDNGYKAVLSEGADHVLGWRSPNYLYHSLGLSDMRLFLRNTSLSCDLDLNFSNQNWDSWPLTSEKYATWCHALSNSADIINIFNDYHVIGLRHPKESGIFEFMEALPAAILAHKDFHFLTPGEIIKKIPAKGEIDVPGFISWADEERDLTAWLGNDMQKDAIHALYNLADRVRTIAAPDLLHDFERLQASDHFHYMSTKWFSEHLTDRPNPFGSPYDAYITFMNVLADFEMRLAASERAVKPKKSLPKASSTNKQTISSSRVKTGKKTNPQVK
jgi:alpha-amylase